VIPYNSRTGLGEDEKRISATLRVRFLAKTEMNWFGEHVAAIQAIASIVGAIAALQGGTRQE
jgi:hypothetical protein